MFGVYWERVLKEVESRKAEDLEEIFGEGVCLIAIYIKTKHMKKNINLNLEENIYQEVRRSVPKGQVSSLVNNFFKEYLKKKQQERLKERLIASYKKTASSKAIKTEDKIWEDAIADGIDK